MAESYRQTDRLITLPCLRARGNNIMLILWILSVKNVLTPTL